MCTFHNILISLKRCLISEVTQIIISECEHYSVMSLGTAGKRTGMLDVKPYFIDHLLFS